jgi:hypothetical protein
MGFLIEFHGILAGKALGLEFGRLSVTKMDLMTSGS